LSSLQTVLDTFIEQEQLPDSYRQTVMQWFIPLAEDIMRRVSVHEGSFVLGVNGSQGSGKSTLAALLVILFKQMLGLSSINLSLDDFYLTRAERQRLAQDVHPLLATRGVPGTHDIGLALKTIEALKTQAQVLIPRFDKAQDDRFSHAQWPSVLAPVDVILLEGWCLGIDPQQPTDLLEPVNMLEAEEDAEAQWRTYVNDTLAQEYRQLFDQLDMLLMLKAPGFEQVIDWRLRQEQKLAARISSDSSRLMSREALQRFIAHYERLTRHALASLPCKADVVFQLNRDQGIESKLKP
jgi:D-glycerate 3-kinase